MIRPIRNIVFVTGTRAEFGLMRSVLEAIGQRHDLRLRIIATGAHLDPRHGRGVSELRREGWTIDAVVPWTADAKNPNRGALAIGVGNAMAHIATSLDKLKADCVVVVGDRVEAFAAAAAAHLSHIPVSHIHGGDRALGQVDDALRHAITKLSHLHFPATRQSARRLLRLGEDACRIHCAGSPGVDGILTEACDPCEIQQRFPDMTPGRFALVLYHPACGDAKLEYRRAGMIQNALRKSGIRRSVIIHPNNDPGAAGVLRRWSEIRRSGGDCIVRADIRRCEFLGLMRDAAMLIGNSSSGIIEAASFGTPVIDIGERQAGRQRSRNVLHVEARPAAIHAAAAHTWNAGRPRRSKAANVYGTNGAGERIAAALANCRFDSRLMNKLIAY